MNPMEFYRNELRRLPLMPALLAQANITVPPDRLICAPNHVYDDTNPSIYVYNEHLVDYGDDRKGYDLLAVAREWLDLDTNHAIALLCDLGGIRKPPELERVQPVPIRPAAYAASLPQPCAVDPNDFALFAANAAESLSNPVTPAGIRGAEYLCRRELYAAALHFGVGVADSRVPARLPSSAWRDMVTFPSWLQGSLTALKGRNLESKESGKRQMRNLRGTGTTPYGLRELTGTGPVYVVEGETDTLSVWTAFEGDVDVVGIPGAGHWSRLKHPLLEGRKFILSLDAHEDAGRRAMAQVREWAAEEGRSVTVLPMLGDKNEILVRDGGKALRLALSDGITRTRSRGARSLR